MVVSRDDARASLFKHPRRRIAAELYTFSLVFRFHVDNNDGRKFATLLVVGVWAALEVGAAYGFASLPNEFYFIRIFVGILIGRMWGIQFNNFAGLEFSYTNQSDSDDDRGD